MDNDRKICTRSIDSLGRLVLPAELRKELDMEEGEALDISVEGSTILLKKHEPCCFVCKTAGAALKKVREKYICAECIAQIEK